MTIIVDDAGSGDLLFGVVIGAFCVENQDFKYDVIDTRYFQPPLFSSKEYLRQASGIVFSLLEKLNLGQDESIMICRGNIFDVAMDDLVLKYGKNRVSRVKVTGTAQLLTETAYIDEISNLGYKSLVNRDEERAKSFHDMMEWLEANPKMVKYAKTGWPRLSRYRFFRRISQSDQLDL
jgi:hypothetical protein